MKITKSQLKQIIKEELSNVLNEAVEAVEVKPDWAWVMPKGYEDEPYTSNIDEVYAFLDKSYEKNQGKESYPTLMGYDLERHLIGKEDLGPNWVRWMVANYFNDKLKRKRKPKQVRKTYDEYIMKM